MIRRKPKLYAKKVRFCPNCKAEYKMIDRCRDCGRYICSVCSHGMICFDCYNLRHANREIDMYMEDKYSRGVICPCK